MDYLKIAQDVLHMEARALELASKRLNDKSLQDIVSIFESLKNFGGQLVVCGVGKSGIIAQKIASTFSSLGLPSHFMHPVEALHGDLGRVGKSDAILFISKSGTTEEILKLVPYLPIAKNMRIAILGKTDSTIASFCDVVLDASISKEACINNQAPTTSSTLALALGDALAVIFENIVGLSKERFAINHPGGILGKSLLLKVSDLMTPINLCPKVSPLTYLKDAILEMTTYPVGACAILDENHLLLGIMMEGDIRRTFTKKNKGLETPVSEILNPKPITINPDATAMTALSLMERKNKQIYVLPVIDENKKFLGFLRLHDLLKEGLGS